jgi:hypothetical protein
MNLDDKFTLITYILINENDECEKALLRDCFELLFEIYFND